MLLMSRIRSTGLLGDLHLLSNRFSQHLLDMLNIVYINTIFQDLTLGSDELATLPIEGTCVKDHLPTTDSSILDTGSENTKKSEIAEGKLKIMIVDNTTSKALEEEILSHANVPLPTATPPVEASPDNRLQYDYRCTTLLVFWLPLSFLFMCNSNLFLLLHFRRKARGGDGVVAKKTRN